MLEKLIADLVFEMRELNRNLATVRFEKPPVVTHEDQMDLALSVATQDDLHPAEQPVVEPAPVDPEPEVVAEQPVVEPAAEPTPEPTPEPPTDPEPAKPTFADVRDAMIAFLKLRGPMEMGALLTKFGCGSIRPNANNLKPEQYADFLAAVKVATEN